MRKPLILATVAAAVAGLAVGGVAGAAESASGAAGWVRNALSGLVEDGTITEDQADAVADALEEARPARPGRVGHRLHVGADVVAEALGVTTEELRAAWRDGRTVAELAEERGVPVDDVVDALVAARREHLAAAVEAGRLTQEQADALLDGAEERARAFVDTERPAFRGGPGGHRGHGRGHHRHHGMPDPESETETETEVEGTAA